MTTKLFSLAGIAMLFLSCSNDDTQSLLLPSTNTDFDYYTVASNRTYTNSENTSATFTRANLLDGKFFSETYEEFIDGVAQGQTTTQHYFYENNRLAKRVYGDDVRDFFYDADGKLIAINARFETGLQMFYRFVYTSADKVFFERITLPYDNPAATLRDRIVLEFDANDNIIKAGKDFDLDETPNTFHTFDYDAADNLIAIHASGGTNTAITYSPVKDNFAKLAYNTFGKKNLMVYQGECYANVLLDGLRQSPNLRATDTEEALIETQNSPYYFRKTKTQNLVDLHAVDVTVTTFYFQ